MAPLQPSTATSKSADFEGAENASEALLAHSRAAAAVYHSAFSAFCMSTTPEEFEAAMDTLEAAQAAEQEARLADMGRMAAITARCECILEQNPQPDAWWAIVGLGVAMEGAKVELVREFEEEREARCHDLFRAAEAKVHEGLLNEDPWECPPIVARIFDNSGGDSFEGGEGGYVAICRGYV